MNDPQDLAPADAAKLVFREVLATDKEGKPLTDKDGKPTGETKQVPVKAAEVLAAVARGNQVTVVTIDGQKLVGTLPEKKAEKTDPNKDGK